MRIWPKIGKNRFPIWIFLLPQFSIQQKVNSYSKIIKMQKINNKLLNAKCTLIVEPVASWHGDPDGLLVS